MRVPPWVGGTPVLPCLRKMGPKQVEKVKRGVREGGIWPFAGAMAAVPPPQSRIGVERGGGKEREKGVQWGRGLVKPPELIKPPPWVVNPQVTRPRPGSEGCREQHPQSGGALHH